MNDITTILAGTALFSGIAPQELDALLGCLAAKAHFYGKNRTVFSVGDDATQIGIVLRGGVQVVRDDFFGNRSILAHLGPGDLFGETFACAGVAHLPVSVLATQDSDILLANYRKVVTTCPGSCAFHARLVQNMLAIVAQKNLMLNQKIEVISRRTTREKLLAFLAAQAQTAGSRSFTIPFNRQQLADYLGVDRSAMSTELGRLQQDGVLRFERNRFEFLDTPEDSAPLLVLPHSAGRKAREVLP